MFLFGSTIFLGTIQYEFASKLRGLEMSEMARLRLLGADRKEKKLKS